MNGSHPTSFIGGYPAAGAYWGLAYGGRGGIVMAFAVATFSGPLAFIINRDLADAFDIFVAAAGFLSFVLGFVGCILGLMLGSILGALRWERSAKWLAPAASSVLAIAFAVALDGEFKWGDLVVWAVYVFIVAASAYWSGASFQRRIASLREFPEGHVGQ